MPAQTQRSHGGSGLLRRSHDKTGQEVTGGEAGLTCRRQWLPHRGQGPLDPAATLIPPGSSNVGKTIDSELEGIRKLRRENIDAYEADKKLQAREMELLDVQAKMQKRNAA